MIKLILHCFFFFKQKTAYEMRISDWSSDVCSSDDVQAFALGFHRCEKSVEVGLVGNRALHSPGIGSKLCHGRVERFLPTAEDEDEGAFLDEALCRDRKSTRLNSSH